MNEQQIYIALGIIALVVLMYFIIQTLVSLQRSLKRLDIVLIETEFKLRKLNSFMNAIENISEIAEKETERIKNEYTYRKINQIDNDSEELTKWLISSVKLGVKIFKGR